MISGRLDGERPSIHGKELDSTICLSCLPGFSLQFSLTHLILQSAMCTQIQSTPGTTCTHWEPRPRRSVQPPVFGSPSATSGRTTPTSVGAGSRSPTWEGCPPQRDQTLARSLAVLQVIFFFLQMFVLEDDILSGHIIEEGCDCTSFTTEGLIIITSHYTSFK